MSYPLVPIGDFATLALRPIQLQPNQEYVGIGVKWYGGGVSEHERRLGAEFNAERFLVRAGDLIYNDMWARKGSVAIVPPTFDGAVGSFHFPTFEVDQARADLRYLALYAKVPRFWEDCEGISRGSTGRNQVRASTFLSLRVPLPDLHEQRRIVARLDDLLDKVQQASSLSSKVISHTDLLHRRLLDVLVNHASADAPTCTVAQLGGEVTSGPRGWSERVGTGPDRFYRAQDITRDDQIAADGVSINAPPGSDLRARVQAGDVLTVITGATIGRCALIQESTPAGFVSQHVGLIRVPQDRVTGEWLWWCLRSELGRKQLLASQYGQGKPGLNLAALRSLAVPAPSIQVQHQACIRLRREEARIREATDHRKHVASDLATLTESLLAAAFSGRL